MCLLAWYLFIYLLISNGLVFILAQITGRLEALLLEANGSWEEAEKAYSSLLEDNPLDQVIIITDHS